MGVETYVDLMVRPSSFVECAAVTDPREATTMASFCRWFCRSMASFGTTMKIPCLAFILFSLCIDAKSPSLLKVRSNSPNKPLTTSASSPWLDGVKSGLASALSAACVKTVLQPIDAIKTYQQYTIATSGKAVSIRAACHELMTRPGGIGNFYNGLVVTVVGAMPGVALYFGVYSYCKRQFMTTRMGKRYPKLTVALSAAIGNSVASFSRVPYEVLKQKLQTGAYDNTWQALTTIARSKEWVRLIFPKGGVAIQMMRDVPYAVVTLSLYELLQSLPKPQNVDAQTWDFIYGGIAGGLGSYLTNPIDVVKTRLQTNTAYYDGSVWKCTTAVWAEGGAAALLRGSVPRLLHKIPANAFFFLFYEFYRRLFGVQEAMDKAASR